MPNPYILVAIAAALGYFLLTSKSDAEEEGQPPEGGGGGPPTLPPGPSPLPAPGLSIPAPRPVAIPATQELTDRATALYGILTVRNVDCAQTVDPTAAFQRQAKIEGRPIGAVDGHYGAQTANVLRSVLAPLKLGAPPPLWGAGGRCQNVRVQAPGMAPPSTGPLPTQMVSNILASMIQKVTAGDIQLGKNGWNFAVDAYQRAGDEGVGPVARAIDVQTHGASKPKTQAAWMLNAQLSKVPNKFRDPSTNASIADAAHARDIAHQMLQLYKDGLGAQVVSGWYTGRCADVARAFLRRRRGLQGRGQRRRDGPRSRARRRDGGRQQHEDAFGMADQHGARRDQLAPLQRP
jgi:hypothetical protein